MSNEEAQAEVGGGGSSAVTTSHTSTESSPTHGAAAAAAGFDGEHSLEYRHLIEYGLDAKVAARLDEIFKTGELSFLFLHVSSFLPRHGHLSFPDAFYYVVIP